MLLETLVVKTEKVILFKVMFSEYKLSDINSYLQIVSWFSSSCTLRKPVKH